jgi:tetratricopeptide (TPR) repeat protein
MSTTLLTPFESSTKQTSMIDRWLFRRYRHLPPDARSVLTNNRLRLDLAALTKVQKRHPRIYAIPHTIADALMKAGRTSEALRVWAQTVRQFPRAPNPYFQRASWALDRRQFQEAEKFLRLCLRRDRGYFGETAHFWRAECLARLGRYESALVELRNVSDDYNEPYFLDYRWRSKADMLKEIQEKSSK